MVMSCVKQQILFQPALDSRSILMVEIFQGLMEFELDVLRAIAVGLVLYSIHVGQLEAVIKSCCRRMALNLFVERLRVEVFHQRLNEELL